MVSKKRQIVGVGARKVSQGSNAKRYLTIHETANTSRGAGAQAHANLQSNGNSRSASWHWQVDDSVAIQSYDHSAICWHAGNTRGNRESIGIEICVNSDGDFKKAVDNAAQLAADILKEEGLDSSALRQHNSWSGKNCPAGIRRGRAGISWSSFIAAVESKLGGSSSGGSSSGSSSSGSSSSSPGTGVSSGYSGASVVDYLRSIGADSSFSNRQRLARQHGISPYSGTASQNTRLLRALRSGSSSSGSSSSSSSSASGYSGASVVDYLRSIGADSSFSNRQRLARQHGISPYSGTAAQNTRLLNALRSGSSSSSSRSSGYSGDSIVDYLNSIGASSSFSNRKRLARQNGISNYRGTAAQNTRLLRALRGF